MDAIEPELVRRWHGELGRHLRQELADAGGAAPMRRLSGPDGSATVARTYRLLRAILQTAVEDEVLVRNPCKIKGAGDPRSVERPVLSIAEIAALAEEVPAHYRAFVIVAGFSGLRAGELAALRIMDPNRAPLRPFACRVGCTGSARS